jgi:peptidoglycan/xylan/chitin deacetylase (PgdA/CDA1 family)
LRSGLESVGVVQRQVVDRGPSKSGAVCLTYDDGPGRCTPELLGVLARHGARATFFMVGAEVERFPEIARRVVHEGHEVGSHTLSHLDHHAVDPADAVADMLAGAEAIERVLGLEPGYYRAPYGYFVEATVAEATRRGWTCVHWTALGHDWEEEATPRSVADHVVADLAPGAIVLLHDSRRAKPMGPEPMLGATELVIEELKRRDLRAVELSAML